MRNRQSARTLYSIFIREDYYTDQTNKNVLDIGSNIGISALYFLSRNKKNMIICFEPDPYNAYFLKKNLEQFNDRVHLNFCAVGTKDSEAVEFNVSVNGKYSSIKKINNHIEKIKVKLISINNILRNTKFNNKFSTLLKIDIEGLEKEVINSINFFENKKIKELIVEGTGYQIYINKEKTPEVINGMIEKYKF